MPPKPRPIGEILRTQRIDVLKLGLREMARRLDVAPAHLTDIELGRRTPSDGLLLRISEQYQIAEAELRTGWSRPEPIVGELATQDTVTATKVPEFLRTARKLKPDQWDRLIKQAGRMASGKKPKSEK